MRYMCAFLFRRVAVEYRRRLRRRRERERERRARESVHRRRLCDQESARPNNFSTKDVGWNDSTERPQSSGIRYGKRLAVLLQGFYLP